VDKSQVIEAARVVAHHRLNRTRLPRLAQPQSVEEGYQVQVEAHRLLADSLGPIAGHKIGATNAAIQRQLGVAHPCAGGVYANTLWESGTTLQAGNLVRPGLECEIAFRLGRDLVPRRAEYGLADLSRIIDACMVSMEIIDDRHQDLAQVHIPTLIADDALDAGVLLGAAVSDWQGLDFPNLVGSIRRNGGEISRAAARNVLGNPLNAVVWLANTYSRQGRTLKAGEFVSTGSIADLVWVKPGEHYLVAVDRLGALEVAFA
jgi:2-oxo-3-hexenedioate decarboxylase/2-keto-4-pentenoate hydratase